MRTACMRPRALCARVCSGVLWLQVAIECQQASTWELLAPPGPLFVRQKWQSAHAGADDGVGNIF